MKRARILVLGGTKFLGRAVVEAALADDHAVTLFNRGITHPELFPEAEKLRGDRTEDLTALEGRRFDAVVDVAAYEPDVAARSAEALAGSVDRYVFVSTVSVYAAHDTTAAQQPGSPVLSLSQVGDDPGDQYGAKKAACEDIVREAFAESATIARPGLIVGPHDPTDRFSYWPRRLALGGRVLAPGAPADLTQFIDVRDLGAWLVGAAVAGTPGTFNLVGLPISFGDLLQACIVPEVPAELVWVPSERLVEAGVDPWMGIPLWIGGSGWEAANNVDSGPALDTGLDIRPLGDTVAAAREHAPPHGSASLSLEEEAELLSRVTTR